MPTVLIVGASSGLIIAFVVAVWAAYFVPLVLRRYDEAGRNASVEEAGSTGRVITPNRPAAPAVQEPEAEVEEATALRPTRTLDRPAARLAARRRRRTLLTLIGLLIVTTVVALVGVLPELVIIAPVALIAAWLVACRIQVRGELGLSKPRRAERADDAPLAMADEDTIIVSGQFEDVDPGRVHVMEKAELEVDSLDDQVVIAVPSASTSGEALWDPLPITVPTYVTKPRAGRTVRTIDFSTPGTWTSGHVEGENTELPAKADQTPDAGEQRRAVNG